MVLRRGWFTSIVDADHPVFNPIGTGTYTGSGDRVTFSVRAPSFNAIVTPPMRWNFDGHALRFRLLGCGDLNHLDPTAPHLCDDVRVTYEAHPWVKVR
jgi:hypothetical protein